MDFQNMFTFSTRIVSRTLAVCLLGTMIACSSDEDPTVQPPVDSSDAITFTTNINAGVATRAANGDWAVDDEVGIFMLDASDKLSEDHHKVNHRYKIAAGEGDKSDTWRLVPYNTAANLYYPVDGSDVHFTAYYPYNSAITKTGTSPAEVPGTYSITLGDQDNTTTFDLLYHKGTAPYKKGDGYVPSMEFKHQLSKVVINIKLGDDMKVGETEDAALLASLDITIKDVPTSADFDLAAGTLSKWGAGGAEDAKGNVLTTVLATPEIETPAIVDPETPAVRYAATHEAIIVPHSATANEAVYNKRTILFAFTDPDGIEVELEYAIPDTRSAGEGVTATTYKAFSPELKTVYVFTLKREKVEVNDVTVKDWQMDGAIIPEDLF